MDSKVYIVIVNWNGWGDTIECLESLFRLNSSDYHIVVVDNGSTDGSIEHIQQWANGNLCAIGQQLSSTNNHYQSPAIKPVKYEILNSNIYNSNNAGTVESSSKTIVTLLSAGSNLGFAGGNNIGIRFAMSQSGCMYIWLLNNDTVVLPDSLARLTDRFTERPSIGICGSTLLYYNQPETVQARGGARYNKCFALARHIAGHQSYMENFDIEDIERHMDYVVGASMLIKKDVLEKIGLLNEDYFLYCEEIDFCVRARKYYALGYAPKSIVYHKEGATTGASSISVQHKSNKAIYYAVKSRFLFTYKFYPWCLPTIYIAVIARILMLMQARKWKQVVLVIKLAFTWKR